MDTEKLNEIRERAQSTTDLPQGPLWDFWRTAGQPAVTDRAALLAEVERLHAGLEALAEHLGREGNVVDGPVVAGALRQVIRGEG